MANRAERRRQRRRSKVSPAEARRALAEMGQGLDEFLQEIESTGHTVADALMMLELEDASGLACLLELRRGGVI